MIASLRTYYMWTYLLCDVCICEIYIIHAYTHTWYVCQLSAFQPLYNERSLIRMVLANIFPFILFLSSCQSPSHLMAVLSLSLCCQGSASVASFYLSPKSESHFVSSLWFSGVHLRSQRDIVFDFKPEHSGLTKFHLFHRTVHFWLFMLFYLHCKFAYSMWGTMLNVWEKRWRRHRPCIQARAWSLVGDRRE